MLGLPNLATTIWFLVDKQDFFHFEMFRFDRPQAKPMPADWRPCDVGYARLGLHVDDFDATLERLRNAGVQTLTDPMGMAGIRRVCVRDPEDVLLELMEEDPRLPSAPPRPRPEVPVAARSVTLSVPDLYELWHADVGVDVLCYTLAEFEALDSGPTVVKDAAERGVPLL